MKLIPKAVTQSAARHILAAKQNSPKMFFAAGIVGVLGGTVLACRATLNLEEELDEIKDDFAKVKANHGLAISASSDELNEFETDHYYRDLSKVYIHAGYRMTKLYGPAVVVTGVSIAALVNSHVVLTRRNAALTAAYAALAKSYDQYRERVREELGEERERELYNAIQWQEVPGSEGKILEPVADPGKWGPTTRFFDETNPNWKNNSEYNRLFINCQQEMANDLLQARGHVFLNDVYDMLNIDRSSLGQLVGWVLGGDGDDYVDFGTFEAFESLRYYEVGGPKPIVLEFNVDPTPVWDQIEGTKS